MLYVGHRAYRTTFLHCLLQHTVRDKADGVKETLLSLHLMAMTLCENCEVASLTPGQFEILTWVMVDQHYQAVFSGQSICLLSLKDLQGST